MRSFARSRTVFLAGELQAGVEAEAVQGAALGVERRREAAHARQARQVALRRYKCTGQRRAGGLGSRAQRRGGRLCLGERSAGLRVAQRGVSAQERATAAARARAIVTVKPRAASLPAAS